MPFSRNRCITCTKDVMEEKSKVHEETKSGGRQNKRLNKPRLHGPHGIAVNQEQGLPRSVS